jgi:hypothetical protein
MPYGVTDFLLAEITIAQIKPTTSVVAQATGKDFTRKTLDLQKLAFDLTATMME